MNNKGKSIQRGSVHNSENKLFMEDYDVQLAEEGTIIQVGGDSRDNEYYVVKNTLPNGDLSYLVCTRQLSCVEVSRN